MMAIVRLLNRQSGIMFAPQSNDALLCRARAKSMTQFLDSDADVWMSIDGDIVFHDAAVPAICNQTEKYGIVAGTYVTRSRDRCFPTTLQEDDVPVLFPPVGSVSVADAEPIPVKWCATGFLAVHRRVFEKIVKRPDVELCHAKEVPFHSNVFTPFTVPGSNGPIYLSEDYAMCERARMEGFQAYVNPAVRLAHVGEYAFRLEDMVTSHIDDIGTDESFGIQLTREQSGRYKIEVPRP